MVSGKDNDTSPASLGGDSSALQPTSDLMHVWCHRTSERRDQVTLATVCPNDLHVVTPYVV